MRAMVLEKVKNPLYLKDIPQPIPKATQVLIKIEACGVCRTDLHIIDGELPSPTLPLVLGHQIVGVIQEVGSRVVAFKKGDRVGVPWLGHTCGHCDFCKTARENLCDSALFTGYQINGGFAEFTVAESDYCFLLSKDASAVEIAPLLCAGLIGYRAYRMISNSLRIGFYGYGSSAHILSQVAKYEQKKIFAFTKIGSKKHQELAKKLGSFWVGDTSAHPPELLDAAIIFAPSGELVPLALSHLKKGGTVICAGIHMSAIPTFPYSLLWEERSIKSVANLTRQDGIDFLSLASKISIHSEVTLYPLEKSNEALEALRKGSNSGSIVINLGD